MHHLFRSWAIASLTLLSISSCPSHAQNAALATAVIRDIHSDGMKTLPESQVVALTDLHPGAQASREDLQAAADKLMHSGLFANVKYNFQSRTDGLAVTFHVQEAPRIPAYFDNLPWFADSELNEAIRKRLSFYDGTLPSDGTIVDQAADALNDFIAAHDIHLTLTHQVIAAPAGEGSVQQFHVEGATLQIASVQFSDTALNSSHVIQQKLSDLVGKAYSKMTIDLFLSEQVRPIYQQQGYLHVKLGPPEVRLTGNPNQKLPGQIPVFVPISPGAVYHWKGADWTGNSVISSITLSGATGLKPGDVADGVAIEAGWDRAREEYAHRGYLDAKVEPEPSYDDHAHTVSYKVRVSEGPQYRFGSMVITGLSTSGEKRLREAFPMPEGELFDKAKFEELLTTLHSHPDRIFKDLPVHFDTVGHWLQPNAEKGTVDVLLDFK